MNDSHAIQLIQTLGQINASLKELVQTQKEMDATIGEILTVIRNRS